MRILNLESGFPPELVSGRLSYEFARELAERGHKVVVVTGFPRKLWVKEQLLLPKAKFFYWERMGKVLVLRCWPQFKGKSLLSRAFESLVLPLSLFAGAFVTGKKGVIHCQSPPLPLAFSACVLKRLTRTPLVLRIQDIHPDALVKIGLIKNKLLIKTLETLEKFVYCSADHITVIADGYKKNILSKGINPEKVTLIPNWADLEQTETAPKNDSVAHNLVNGKFVVTYAGTMSWPQDLETAIEAANLLRNHENISFLFVGEGIKKEILMKRAHELKLDNVKFMPLQPREVYFQILHASSACLVPLRKSYNSPTAPSKMLEIMANRKPIIANVPINSEVHKIVNQAKCGVWVEPENPQALSQVVLNLHKDRDLAQKLGENGRKFVEENMSMTTSIDRYESLFESLLAKTAQS